MSFLLNNYVDIIVLINKNSSVKLHNYWQMW